MTARTKFCNWIFALSCVILIASCCRTAEPPKVDPNYPFRTDYANEQLPWYQLKPGEFPPHHSDHRVGGELIEADFIHRSGVFRINRTGELVNFTLPPFGSVMYLNTEADLRDVPLGTRFLFFLYQDEKGAFTKVATMQDEYTMLAGHGFTYCLDEIKLAEGKLLVTKQKLSEKQPDLGHSELLVNDKTRVWKGDKQVKLGDLAVGDSLLVNLTGTAKAGGSTPQISSCCADIWLGVETHKLATEQARKTHKAFLKVRGLPAWIDRVDGKKLTVTFFSGDDRNGLQPLFKDEGVVPAQYAKEHRQISAAVANEELRSYNPPVDKEGSTVLEVQRVPTDCYGCSGERWIIEPNLLLEGFRKGRIVRLFMHPSWPINDMPFGEGLYSEAPGVKSEEHNPNEYPFRTDFANESLPWYQLKPGEFPPCLSEHRVCGELVKADAIHRAGQFRTDRTGELVDFTLPPFGSVIYLNAEADLGDMPLGTRAEFFLHQDEKGAFTKATVIMDEYSRLASNKFTYRLEAARLDEGKLFVAKQIPIRENDLGHMEKPPDLGRTELIVDEKTCVWKGDKQIKLSDLAVGDDLIVNLSGATITSPSRCTAIWAGAETHKLASDTQRKKHDDFIKEHGMPAWIDRVEGKKLTVTLFSGSKELLNSDPKGKNVFLKLADQELHTQGATADKMKCKDRLRDGDTVVAYGCSNVRWVIEPDVLPAGYLKGQIIRVFKEGWPVKD